MAKPKTPAKANIILWHFFHAAKRNLRNTILLDVRRCQRINLKNEKFTVEITVVPNVSDELCITIDFGKGIVIHDKHQNIAVGHKALRLELT